MATLTERLTAELDACDVEIARVQAICTEVIATQTARKAKLTAALKSMTKGTEATIAACQEAGLLKG